MRTQRFAGKAVVVTGGSGGLGRAVCEGFAAEGARVAVVDVDAAAVADVGGAEGFVADVRDPAAVAGMMQQVHERLGGPHVLVTLAGGSLGTPPAIAQMRPEDVDAVLDVNVKGTFYCCQAAVPYMSVSGGGAIVTVSSIGGRQPSLVTGVPYAAAKAAVTGLTRRLAREVGSAGIRVNAIAPGLFLTERLRRRFEAMPQSQRREVLEAIPLGRLPELREAVDPILFLSSDESSYLTGVVLDVNGGRFMAP